MSCHVSKSSAVNGLTVGTPVEPLEAEVASHPDRAGSDVLGAVLFHDGVPQTRLLGFAQEHGGWIDWRAPAA